ncbi:MAG: hypothetical protein RLY86_1203 [Pseudomonadota bacterium]|jgi:predicted FMN-binding regulatory protein PaiB/AraC-like DNA-binding protein
MASCGSVAAFATGRPGLVGVEARLSDFAFPPHSHDHVCIGLMRAGEKSSRYGLRRHTVGPGDVILVNPGEVHDGRSVGRADRAYTMLEIDGTAFARICREGIGRDGVVFERPVLRDPRVSAALVRWIALLKAGSVAGDAAASNAAERDAAALVLGALSWRGAEGEAGGGTVSLADAPGRDIAWRVVRRMREKEAGGDVLQDLAREVGASRFQVIRAFHRTFGLSPAGAHPAGAGFAGGAGPTGRHRPGCRVHGSKPYDAGIPSLRRADPGGLSRGLPPGPCTDRLTCLPQPSSTWVQDRRRRGAVSGCLLLPVPEASVTYPPPARLIADPAAACDLMSDYPFAHLFTSHDGLRSTRIPFMTDREEGRPVRLRAHVNRQNPQVPGLDGGDVLVVFSGPSTYVSPHWRAQPTRAGTFDYEEVRVHGTARVVDAKPFFLDLINDLSALIEPRHAAAGDYPVWTTDMAPEGYIDRLFPAIVCFEIRIKGIGLISKPHQHFPAEDRAAIARHLSRLEREESRLIAGKILAQG